MSAKRMLWTLVALLVVAVAGVAVYKVWPLLHPEVVASAPLDPDCNLRAGPCTGVLPGGGKVTFSIAPADIPVVQPLQLSVQVQGMGSRGVDVDFAGVDMDMGYNRTTLHSDAPGRYSGSGMLPVCVRSRMRWEARVLVHTGAGLPAAPFRFDTFQPGAPSSR